jgi:hypothetical protein
MADTPGMRAQEPVLVNSGITNAVKTFVLAVISMALAFEWVTWTDAQIAAVLGVVAAAFVVLSATSSIFTRALVTPIASSTASDGLAPVPEAG